MHERKNTMKDTYLAPEMEIISFEAEDVITTSPPVLPAVGEN